MYYFRQLQLEELFCRLVASSGSVSKPQAVSFDRSRMTLLFMLLFLKVLT
jgi:hypothetical protein